MSFIRKLFGIRKDVHIDLARLTPGDEVFLSRFFWANPVDKGARGKRKDYLTYTKYPFKGFNISFEQNIVRTKTKQSVGDNRSEYIYYSVDKKLDEGSEGFVYQGLHAFIPEDSRNGKSIFANVAIKLQSDFDGFPIDEFKAKKETESELFQRVDPAVKPHTFAKENGEVVRSWMIMPFYGVSLANILDEIEAGKRPELTDLEYQTIAINMLAALQHVHSKNIVHHDIKHGNIIVDPETLAVHIADYGSSRDVGTFAKYSGTKGYIAPEVAHLEHNPKSSMRRRIDQKADVFSMGKVLETLTDKLGLDFKNKSLLKVLLSEMTAANPKQRPSSTDVLTRFNLVLGREQPEKEISPEAQVEVIKTEISKQLTGIPLIDHNIQEFLKDSTRQQYISDYLEKLDLTQNEMQDLLENAIADLKAEAFRPRSAKEPKDDGTREFLNAYFNELESAKMAGKIPSNDYLKTIELSRRILFRAKNWENRENVPHFAENDKQCAALASAIYSAPTRWGCVLGGIVLAMLGVVLVAGAVTALVASFGAPLPLVAALSAVGIKVSAAAVTTAIGVTGVGATATLATGTAVTGFMGAHIAGHVVSVASVFCMFNNKAIATPRYATIAQSFFGETKQKKQGVVNANNVLERQKPTAKKVG